MRSPKQPWPGAGAMFFMFCVGCISGKFADVFEKQFDARVTEIRQETGYRRSLVWLSSES
jgi:hypothetical protein